MAGERDYSEMSPRGMCLEFIGLLDQFPPEETFDDLKPSKLPLSEEEAEYIAREAGRRIHETMDRRANSEHKQIVLGKLNTLVDLSHLTATGKRVLKRRLDFDYDAGVEKGEASIIDTLVDFRNPSLGGMYNPARVEGLERAFYLGVAESIMDEQLMLDKSTFEIDGRVLTKAEVAEYFGKLQQNQDEYYGEPFGLLLAKWRDQFIQKYDDEP